MSKRTYIAIAEQRDDKGWSISFPAFLGTTSGAESVADLMSQAREALETVVEDFQNDHEPLPPSLEDGAGLDYDRAQYRNPHVLFVDVEISPLVVPADALTG